ncbi:hypothetical protein [Castellaniella sp.]|uniref:hypothetical protein n=1 Tax=Castellaniella sp. TaxID=1955812 RepID=UPI002AFDDCF9|nr:hypothetical protein [Castellaniella sp.]
MADAFYLQDSRCYVGNDMLFWALGGKGYTTDLRRAEVYTREEAQAQHDSRSTDIPWPKDYIDAKTRPACDMQHVKRDEALADAGIVLRPRYRERKSALRCQCCGAFISQANFWAGSCPRCGGDSRP